VWRLMAPALGTALAATARGDLGLDVGVGAIVALVASHWRDGFRVLFQRAAIFGATLAAALIPFLVALQLSGGVGDYYRIVLAFGRAEKDQLSFERPGLSVDPSAPLVDVDPSSSRRIDVEWAKRVSPKLGAELERKYGLTNGGPDPEQLDGRLWTYDLTDLSTTSELTIASRSTRGSATMTAESIESSWTADVSRVARMSDGDFPASRDLLAGPFTVAAPRAHRHLA
jgi:hypothetical protein